MSRNPLLLIAGVLVVLGIVSFVLQPVLDPKPDTKCVADGEPSSGFVDDEKDCNVSIESYEDINDWESSPKPFRIAGLVLIVAGLVTGGVGFMRSRRGETP